jgi:transcriptional regulator with XRE-family HTH domain
MDEGISLGELLRRTRRARGQSQQDVADLFGVNQSTVAKWERGDPPAVERIGGIAEYLERPKAEVMAMVYGGEENGVMAKLDEILANQRQIMLELVTLRAVTRAHDGNGTAPAVEVSAPVQAGQRRRRLARTGRAD